jgi:hypothetical protein
LTVKPGEPPKYPSRKRSSNKRHSSTRKAGATDRFNFKNDPDNNGNNDSEVKEPPKQTKILKKKMKHRYQSIVATRRE